MDDNACTSRFSKKRGSSAQQSLVDEIALHPSVSAINTFSPWQCPKPLPPQQHQAMDDEKRLKEFFSSYPKPTLPILVLGAPKSGKRSVCNRLAHDVFPVECDPTEDGHYRRLLQIFPQDYGKDFRVMLEWTTILTDAAKMIPSVLQYLVRAHEAFILVYRTADRATFEAVEGLWRDHIAEKRECAVLVVANGGEGNDVVSESEGQDMADSLGATFWQLSAKTGDGAAEEQLVAMAKSILLYNMRRIRTAE